MSEPQTVSAKYVFLDVVGFTRRRSVEAQTDIVAILNAIVRSSLEENNIQSEDMILLPTGDGICIALLGIDNPLDVHLRLAMTILAAIAEHDQKTSDQMRQFEVRIGLNANVDNVVTDINANRNVAGAGINEAQRIMAQADASQIMLGQAAHNTLSHREQYLNSFRRYNATIKHGVDMPVFQYVCEGAPGLNSAVPSAFQVTSVRLSAGVAHRIALCLTRRSDIIRWRSESSSDAASVFLWFLCRDGAARHRATEANPFWSRMPGGSNPDPKTAFNHMDDWVLWAFQDELVRPQLAAFQDCFDDPDYSLFPNERGKTRLRNEWPGIWKAYGLDVET